VQRGTTALPARASISETGANQISRSVSPCDAGAMVDTNLCISVLRVRTGHGCGLSPAAVRAVRRRRGTPADSAPASGGAGRSRLLGAGPRRQTSHLPGSRRCWHHHKSTERFLNKPSPGDFRAPAERRRSQFHAILWTHDEHRKRDRHFRPRDRGPTGTRNGGSVARGAATAVVRAFRERS
jgi:hypothetical protein